MQAKEGDFEKKNTLIFFCKYVLIFVSLQTFFLVHVSLQTYFKYIVFSRPLIRKISFKEITPKLN